MKPIIVIISLLFSLPSFAQNVNTEKYLVPITRPEVNTHRLYSKEASQYKTVCVEEQCYYVVSELTAKKLLSDGVADSYEPVIYRKLFAPVTFAVAPSDTNFSDQWALNDSQIGWLAGKDIMDTLPGLTRNSGPVAAVIDTGITDAHMDINYNNNEYKIFWENSDGSELVYSANNSSSDTEGHGTHVAGIIGAATGNNFGVASTGYGKVHVLPARASNGGNSLSNEEIIASIGFIINQKKNNGVPIIAINMSFGSDEFSQAEYDAIERLKNAGIIAVTAAGNGNAYGYGYSLATTPIYPGSYDLENIVTVASLTSSLSLAGYSNYGGTVGIAAPGDKILSTAIYFLGKGLDNSTNPLGVLYQSTNELVPTNIPSGSNWSRNGEKLKYTPGSGGGGFTVDNINLNEIAGMKNRSVSLNYDSGLICRSNCSLNMYVKLNNASSWGPAVASTSDSEDNKFLFYAIPSTATNISVQISVNGTLSGSSSGVTINKLLIGGANYADSLTILSGTSMAAPFVVGALTAGAAVYGDFSVTASKQLMNMLYDSAKPSAKLTNKVQGSRQIDMAAFLQAVKNCKDAGGACTVSTDYPERIGGFNEDDTPSSVVKKKSSGGGCAVGGTESGVAGSMIWMLAPVAWLARRRLLKN